MRGAVPYLDVFDLKPPLIDAAYRLAFALLGENALAVRLLALSAACLTAALLFWIGFSLGRPGEGALAGMFYGVSSALPGYNGGTANTEMLLVLPLCGGWLAGLAGMHRGSRSLMGLAGAAWAWLACASRPPLPRWLSGRPMWWWRSGDSTAGRGPCSWAFTSPSEPPCRCWGWRRC
jgi:hypothetical protein